MKRFGLALWCATLFSVAHGQTTISGNISSDSTWTLAKSPYVVTSSFNILNGITLTVDPGVVVRFQSGTFMYVQGHLVAHQATFTSNKDTAGGTPQKGDWGAIYANNGSATLEFDTCSIKFGGSSGVPIVYASTMTSGIFLNTTITNSSNSGIYLNASGSVVITNSVVSNSSGEGVFINAGSASLKNTSITTSSNRGLYLQVATTGKVDSCTISGSSNHGIHIYGGTDTVRYTSVLNSGNQGIYVQSGSATIIGCTVNTTTNNGIYFEAGTAVTLTGSTISSTQWPLVWNGGTAILTFNGTNTFSSNFYNGIYMSFGGTTANTVLDTAIIPYYFPYGLTVNSGHSLWIASTNVLKFAGNSLTVNGSLNAVAGLGQYIYLTSYRDDNLPTPGSDTNHDGIATVPHAQDWYGVIFNDSSVDSASIMKRCKVVYAGAGQTGGITMYNASPTVDSCDMSINYYGAMMQYVSNPVFTNNTIGSSQMVPIAMAFTASPTFANNTFSSSDNNYDALGLLGGTLTANANLPIRKVVRIYTPQGGSPTVDTVSNITYLLLDQVTVPSGRTLTINKGVVIKAYAYWQRLVVQGKLVANATPDSMIVMTSSKDDNKGHPGDSNRNGNSDSPARGDWGGITFESGSDTSSILNYCSINYGALPSYYYYFNGIYLYGGAITTINIASPTISNCLINQGVFGIYAYGNSTPKVTNTQIVNSQYTPIAMSVPAEPFFSADTFVNSGWTAIGIIGEYLGASGTIKKRNVSGFNNITYVLLGDLIVNSGTNVTVDPGVVIKSGGPGFYVNGGFKAKGTIAGGQVVFTSLKDDNYGNPGDTNGDGNGSSASAGDWSTIRFQATSDDVFSLLDSCVIKYSGNSSWGAVTYTDAGSTLSNSSITNSYNFGIRCENSSTPNVNGVSISACRLDPIAMSLLSNPTFTNITFSANGSRGLRILEGTLASNATLPKRDVAGITNIAYVMDNLTINSGAVLTIQPGVVIKFTSYYNGIGVNGALVANGTQSQRIVFTSIRDDSNGGDTNNDGNGSSPDKGNWNAIDFGASSSDTLNVLKNCDLRYGGGYNYSYEYGAIRVYNTTVNIDSCIIEQSATSGIGVYGSAHPTMSRTQVNNIAQTPVMMSMFSTPTFSNITSLNVGYMGIGIKPETYSVTAAVPVRNFAGYTSIPYIVYGTLTVNTGTTITIPAGLVFKDGNWVVNGSLIVNGTPSQKVVFTDSRDDSYGNPGDTQNNGAATTPSIQGFHRITFNDVSVDSLSIIQNAIFRYTESGVYLSQASPKLLDCTFDHTNWGTYLTGVSNPAIDSCTFNSLTYAPMRLSLVSYPGSSAGNVISGSTYKAIGVLENETLVQDVTLSRRSFGGVAKIPYLFANYTVASNAVLTISPGVVLKFFPGTGMSVHKGLMALGGSTPDSLIVFTELRDDFYGGDANSDSTASTPTSYYPFYYNGWNGVSFADESLDPLCQLKNCVFRYSGISYSGAAITTNNASPTITFSNFNNNYDAIVANGSSNPIVNYNDIFQNGRYGVNNVNKSFTIDARWNWWGSNSGPTHSSNPGGSGQSVTDAVNYTPYLTVGASNPMIGDVSLNGSVQAFDASLILKYVVNPHGADSLTALQRRVADVSGNGGPDTVAITSYDASLILQYVVGLIPKFPASGKHDGGGEQLLQTALALQKVSAASLEVGQGHGSFGGTVTVPLSVQNAVGISGFQVVLNYDPAVLNPTSVTASGIASGMNMDYYAEAGRITIAYAGSSPLASSGDIGSVTFEISKDARGSFTSPIGIAQFMANETIFAGKAGDVSVEGRPTSFELQQNFPNPFNPSTNIKYLIPDDNSQVSIVIYNLLGQRVRTLVDGAEQAGVHSITWNGRDDSGIQVGSGVYIYQMIAEKFVQSRKLMLLK